MASNNFNINPYMFSMPPPNYNPGTLSWNQNWKPPVQNQEAAAFKNIYSNPEKSTNHLQRSSIPPPQGIPQQSYQMSTPPKNYSNSASAYPNMHLVQNNERSVPQTGSKEMSPLPPPPVPPPYLSSPNTPTTAATGNAQNYYMPTQQLPYIANRYTSGSSPYISPPLSYSPITEQYPPTPPFYPQPPPVPHNLPPPQLPPSNQYSSTPSPGYNNRNNYYKRKADSDFDSQKKNKKRKKPLSQNIPQRKDWSVEDAKKAIEVEMDYNKRNRSQSLIIKFPDAELNRDLVSGFHPSIESVHFQQPSTPRFCFVTLKDGVNPDDVIEHLNKTPFGHGFLVAEYKKDREDEMNIGPEDIDPLTLYIGNLAQDVIKKDMVQIYPKHKRVDIGYAKKMKYTRYAFVSFKNVDDAIEAFKKTHATQMYSKSLIVRFRRLHGTVGMPGEPKPQLPQRNESDDTPNGQDEAASNNQHEELAPWEMVDVSNWDSDRHSVKQEPTESLSEEEAEEKPKNIFSSPFMPGSLEIAFSLHRPIVAVKEEENRNDAESKVENVEEKSALDVDVKDIKSEIKKESVEKKFSSTYSQLQRFNVLLNGNLGKCSQPEVKEEVVDSLAEKLCQSREDEVESTVKSEPLTQDDEADDGDEDNSSEEDFNFGNFLSKMDDKVNKLRKLKSAIL